LEDVGVQGKTVSGRHGIWGRTGQLAAVGVAVRGWVSYFGVYINVSPPLGLFRIVETDRMGHTRMSSLVAERGPAVRMASVRTAVIRHLAESLGCPRYHMYTGHPLLRRVRSAAIGARE
jgi:lipoate-protein ligase B